MWTMLQLLESEDKKLIGLIGKSDDIVEMIKQIANRPVDTENELEDVWSYWVRARPRATLKVEARRDAE